MKTIQAFNTILLGLLTAAFALGSSAAVAAPGEIAVIVKTTNSNFWQNVNKGASAAIEGSGFSMTFDGPASEAAVADQVNLLDNAVKYSEVQTSIKIHVKMYELVTCIAVEDQGIGIVPAEKTKIFQRFYRSPDIHQKEGIGIGLYLAREIVQKQKG